MDKNWNIPFFELSEEQLLDRMQQEVQRPNLSRQEASVWKFIASWHDHNESIQLHTSGSTGKPKKIDIPKSWIRSSCEASAQALNIKAGMEALLCIPAQYIGGMMMIARSMILRMNLLIQEPSSNPAISNKVDFTALVPLQVQNLLIHETKLNTYGTIIIGGAAVSQTLKTRLSQESNPIFATYGMTETVSHIALQRLSNGGQNPYFKALAGVCFKTSNEGALLIQVSHFDNQLFETRDIVSLRDEHTFEWMGRLDNVINSGGLKMQPEAIEKKLNQVLDIEYFIHHEPHETYGSALVLCLEAESISEDRKELIYSSLTNYHKPKEIYGFTQFSRSPSGKLLRKETFEQKKRRLT